MSAAATAPDTKTNAIVAAAPTAGATAAAGGVKKLSLFIGGKFVAPLSGAYVDVIDPATETVIAQCANGNAADVDAAVTVARATFDAEGGWADTTGAQRAVYLKALAAAVTRDKARLAALETRNSGKPLKEAEWDMDDVAGCFAYYAGAAEELDAKQNSELKIGDARFTTHMRYEAAGVAGCIIPWNYPLLMLAWKVAPALAAGCTIVLKPSELTPLTAMEFAALTVEVGLPAGVFNVVTGLGPSAGAPLAAHKSVDKVAFTGSVPTGVAVAQLGAPGVKSVTLELGGKSPIVVFDDADVDKAVEWIMFGCFWTNGQICSATSRLLVQKSIAPKLLARLVEETNRIHIGDPNAADNKERTGMIGPVVSAAQYARVTGMIASAVKAGAKVLAGGKRPAGPAFAKGYFVEPTILAVDTQNRIWRDEVFGPVLSVVEFDDEKHAVSLANDSDFGLAGAVLTADKARAARVVRRMRCGIAWVNCSQPCFVEAPWGGVKLSGVGRELGPWGLANYLQPKQITTYVAPEPWAWYIKPKL